MIRLEAHSRASQRLSVSLTARICKASGPFAIFDDPGEQGEQNVICPLRLCSEQNDVHVPCSGFTIIGEGPASVAGFAPSRIQVVIFALAAFPDSHLEGSIFMQHPRLTLEIIYHLGKLPSIWRANLRYLVNPNSIQFVPDPFHRRKLSHSGGHLPVAPFGQITPVVLNLRPSSS
jgi:hypothetical protein